MLRTTWVRRAFTIVLLFVIAACSGGGCSSGCTSCGMTPLAGGFPNGDAIPNAGAARVTRPGIDFLAANAPTLAQKLIGGTNGVYQYPIGKSSGSASGFSYTLCPNGPNPMATPLEQCTVDVEVGMAKFNIDAVSMDTNTAGENSIVVTGTLPVRLQELPVSVAGLTINVGLGTGSCNGSDPGVSYTPIPVDVEIPLIAGTMEPRNGYTTIDVKNMKVTLGLVSSDLSLCGCGALSVICDPIVAALQGTLFTSLSGSLTSQITNVLNGQLCTKPVAAQSPPCPNGSQPSGGDGGTGGTCVYTADPTSCVPIQLGLDGHLNLGTLLAKYSPGTTGGLDILLGAGGAMDPAPDSPADNTPYTGHTPNGITLGLLGGADPSPQSTCVPAVMQTVPQGIPIPDELKQDKQTPWPMTDPNGPDIGIALAGRYIDYLLGSVYNSGTLCLGITTNDIAQLNSGLLSVLIKSVKYLTWEQKPAAAAITTRPQKPPTVKVGGGTDINTDPLLLVTVPSFAIDFYIWSSDRFVRAFTFTSDLTIPVNLETAVTPANPNGGLLPALGNVGSANGVVTNNELLLEDPTAVASALSAILGGLTGQLTGALKPINLASALSTYGLTLTIPDGGIRKLTKGTDDFIGIFGDLGTSGMMMMKRPVPSANLVGQVVHPEAMTLTTFDRAKLPALHVQLASEGSDPGNVVEYTWWIDQGSRSPWSTVTDLTIQNDYLFLQGKHTLYVTARVAGHAETEAETPAAVPFVIDVLPPTVVVSRTATGASVTAWDLVTDDADLQVQTRTTDLNGVVGPWSAWHALPAHELDNLDQSVTDVAVGVRDGSGNITVGTALIRGRPDPSLVAAGAGCSCSLQDSESGAGTGLALALGLGVVILGAARRGTFRGVRLPRGPRVAVLGLGAIAMGGGLNQGCACGNGNSGHPINNNGTDGATEGGNGGSGCGSDCKQMCEPALPMGLVGAYTSMAKASDGTIWVAGYNDSAVSSAFSGLYGDLVVGKYDPAKMLVAWQSVDGLPPAMPAGTCVQYDPTGWRQGQSDPGPDVGLWTSLQIGAGNNPIVSYYDATNQALKFASYDGTSWSSHTVAQAMGSDIGRYSKMLVVSGNPVIAFLVMEPGNMGKIRSKVRLATGNVATPKSAADWALTDAAVDENGPCRQAFCTGTDICITETNSCATPATGCAAGCGGGDAGSTQMCVSSNGMPICGTPISSSYIDIYPNAYADYVSLASGPKGLGIVVYDRIHGNLLGVTQVGGNWQTTIFDGETGSRAPSSGPDGGISAVDTGDVGVGADLFIDTNGDWHVSYVNGSLETLQYMLVPGGAMPTNKPEVVDDGTKLAGQAFADGLHIVGDDSFIAVDSTGVVTISYQDATVGTLRVAKGTPGGANGTHTWTQAVAAQPSRFAGFFSHFIPGDTQIANWWRASDPTSGSISGDVAFVASP